MNYFWKTALFLLWSGSFLSAHNLCGMLSVPTTLTKSSSPHYIKGDIFVPAASRLTIEAGAEIIVAPSDSCQEIRQLDWADSQFVSIKIYGAFYVKGTASEPVTIRSQKPQTGKATWDGIRLYKHTPDYADIKFLHISDAHKAIQTINGSFSIKNSIFTANNVGIWADEQSKLEILNNTLVHNLNTGIYTQNSSHKISANIFAENVRYGIWADSRKGVDINHNLFWKNGTANCYRCPVSILNMVQINAQGDSLDRFHNLRANPIFVGSPTEAQYQKRDPHIATPRSQVKDPEIQALHRRNDSLGLTGLDPQGAFIPWGQGSWLLSKYSPARHAAPNEPAFVNPDSSRGDLGAWGALGQYRR